MKIEPGTTWRHTSGRIYTVLMIANENASGLKSITFQPTVVYKGKGGEVWAKFRGHFLDTMTLEEREDGTNNT